MKKIMRIASVAFFLGFVSVAGFAQDTEEITDVDLWRYALMMEVVDQMKKDISVEINKMIKAQEGMTGQRYTELAGTKGDTDALTAIEAKDWEIKFLEQTTKLMDDRTEVIKSVVTDLATKMVGNRGIVYKSVKEQLKADAGLKSRYDAISNGIKLEALKAD